jgi:hypothetical protein
MVLREYLSTHKIHVKDFARRIGCTQVYLYQIMGPKHRPGSIARMCIFYATGGEVTPEDWK